MLEPTKASVERVRRLIRSNLTATLLYDSTPFETRWMIDPRTGDGIVAIETDALSADDVTLACPKDTMDTPVRLCVALKTEVTEEQRDRFTAYHTPAIEPALAVATLNFVKVDSGEVFEPKDLALANPLVSSMGPLCKLLNQDRAKLTELCNTLLGTPIQDPTCVGVDDTGIDIRAHHRVLRLDLPAPVADADEATRVLQTMLGSLDA